MSLKPDSFLNNQESLAHIANMWAVQFGGDIINMNRSRVFCTTNVLQLAVFRTKA